MAFYSDLMAFYSDLMGFYSDLMGFYSDLMGCTWGFPLKMVIIFISSGKTNILSVYFLK